MKKGYTIVLDSVVALFFAVIIVAAVYSLYYTRSSVTSMTGFKSLHFLCEDILDVLNKQGVLDLVGEEWAASEGNVSSPHWGNASNITAAHLNVLIPENVGYRVLVEDDVLAARNGTRLEDDAFAKTHAVRVLVGYEKGMPTRGFVARAFLNRIREKTTSSYAYFGGFVGQGNLTAYIRGVPDDATILSAYMELNSGSQFKLYVNDNYAGTYTPSAGNMTANVRGAITDPGHFTTGDNKIDVMFTGGDINKQYVGGGYIKLTYTTAEMDSDPENGTRRYWFPKISGLINHYSSFYIPGALQSMNAHLDFLSEYITFFTIGDVVVYNQSGNGSQIVDLDNSYLSARLDYNSLGEKTVPIRLGVQNISGQVMGGGADVILTTDLSFSMWDDRCMEGGWHTVYDRDDPLLNDTTEAEYICTSQCVKPGGGLCHYGDGCNGCTYGCWRSWGCGINDGSSCSLPCYACIWYGGIANPPSGRPYGGSYCYDCTNLGCTYCFEYSEVGEWCTLSCGPNVYAYWGINGTASNPYAPAPPGQCSLYTCTSASRPTCSFYGHHSCDQQYVHQHTTYAGDGLPVIRHLPCPNKCFACNLTGVGLAKQLDANFTSKILNVSGNKVGLLSYGDDTYDTHTLSNDTSSLNARINSYIAGGETCICCALEDSINLLSGSNISRNKFILLMTDGEANVRCNNAFSDLDGDSQITAKDDAIQYACDAYNDYNITVYSVGFGSDAGSGTLQAIADCGNGSFYASNDTGELEAIYGQIADDIVESSYISQIINISGMPNTSILSPESYIGFNYIPINVTGYGELSLTLSTDPFNDTETCTGILYVPSDVRIVDAKVTSYSSEHWTDYLKIDNSQHSQEVYNLWSDFGGVDYTALGDPYIVQTPIQYLLSGENNYLNIETGDSQTNRTGCSPDDRAIYTVRLRTLTEYGDVFPENIGCRWTIEFEDLSTMTASIPKTYGGGKSCSYQAGNVTYDESDAIDDAVYRLLDSLDLDDDGKVDVEFDTGMVDFDFSRTGDVRSLWGPIKIKLIVWM